MNESDSAEVNESNPLESLLGSKPVCFTQVMSNVEVGPEKDGTQFSQELSNQASNPDTAQGVWDLSMKLVGLA